MKEEELKQGERSLNLALIRQKCIEVRCPNASRSEVSIVVRHPDFKIHLADVLLAINSQSKVFVEIDMRGRFVVNEDSTELWNLRKDDLTEQSDKCIKFLADLLA